MKLEEAITYAIMSDGHGKTTDQIAAAINRNGWHIRKDGKIIAEGVNRVTANNDPTAHAEVTAIRKACSDLKTFDLTGCTIYTSCEPCPMCLGAIYWSHIDRMYYGNTQKEAAKIDFDDKFIYDEIARPVAERRLTSEPLLHEEAWEGFQAWVDNTEKVEY